jgi:hypothetical protein
MIVLKYVNMDWTNYIIQKKPTAIFALTLFLLLISSIIPHMGNALELNMNNRGIDIDYPRGNGWPLIYYDSCRNHIDTTTSPICVAEFYIVSLLANFFVYLTLSKITMDITAIVLKRKKA